MHKSIRSKIYVYTNRKIDMQNQSMPSDNEDIGRPDIFTLTNVL